MDEDIFRGGFRTSLTNEEMLAELRVKSEEKKVSPNTVASNVFEAEFIQKFQ